MLVIALEAQSSLATRRVDARMELRDIFMALLKRDRTASEKICGGKKGLGRGKQICGLDDV